MERLDVSELIKDNIIQSIETSRKATMEINKLMCSGVISNEITDDLNWVFDGLWQLLYILYPIETLDEGRYDKLYRSFMLYLEGDSEGPETLNKFFKMMEE